jgi:hypothetical protein
MRNAILLVSLVTLHWWDAVGQIKKSPPSKYQLVEASLGIWIPTGQARLLGNHLMAGFKVGGSIGKFGYYWASDVRFGKSSENYFIKYNDSPFSTNDFHASFYSGLAGYVNLHTTDVSDWFSSIGIGVDRFTSFTGEPPNYPDRKFIGTINFNLGFGVRTYPWSNKNRYVIFELNYNFVDYQNNGGSRLSGDIVTLRVALGFRSKSVKHTKKDLLWR